MLRMSLITLFAVAAVACAQRGGPLVDTSGPIVDMKGVDAAQYRIDLMECNDYADQVAVGKQALGGAAVGAAVGGLVGAVAGNSDAAKRSAGAGAVLGGAGGTADGIREQQTVVRNCLLNRGYAVLN